MCQAFSICGACPHLGMLKTGRHTKDHSVRSKMVHVQAPTLLISGANDRICDTKEAEAAAKELLSGQFLRMPKCGHAPQIEKAWHINRLVVHFLSHPRPTSKPGLAQLLLLNSARHDE